MIYCLYTCSCSDKDETLFKRYNTTTNPHIKVHSNITNALGGRHGRERIGS